MKRWTARYEFTIVSSGFGVVRYSVENRRFQAYVDFDTRSEQAYCQDCVGRWAEAESGVCRHAKALLRAHVAGRLPKTVAAPSPDPSHD